VAETTASRKARPPAPVQLSPSLARLAAGMDDGVFWIDPTERIRFWNDSMARISALALDLEKATLVELLQTLMPDPLEQRLMLESIRQLLSPGEHLKLRLDEMPVQTMTGATKRLEFELVPLAPKDGHGVLAIVHDETRRIKAQRDLETLLRFSSDGILVFAQDGQITLFNDALERMTGYKREEVLYQSGACRKIFECTAEGEEAGQEPGSICLGRIAFSGAGQTIEPCEQLIKTRDGRRRWVEISYSPINDPSGKPAYVICIIRDVHEKKRVVAQMQLHHKLATLGELVGGLAHEIRNPLGIIRSAADVVANEERPMAQRREAALFLQEEAQTLGRIMDALLNLAAPAKVEDAPVDVNVVLQRMVSFYAPDREDLTIETDLAPNLPRVYASRDALQTVFLNLMMNADQAMSSGGMLRVTTERVEDKARIRFIDNGPGILPEAMDQIFQPFFTTKKDGTGMGLPLVAHVINAHGGSIHAENHSGGGAVFTIDLPGTDREE